MLRFARNDGQRGHSLFARLLNHFGPQHWWPAGTAWEMMVGAILTQNTSWTNVEKAISALKSSRSLTARAIAAMPRRRLEKLIRPSGYFRQKAERLQRFARALIQDPNLFKSRERLLAQHGIGPETADAILLYAAHRPVFVVDAYTRRIGRRVGLFRTDDYDEIQRYFQLRAATGGRPYNETVRLYNEFHALLVRLAKEVCTKSDPMCGRCPIRKNCEYYSKTSPRRKSGPRTTSTGSRLSPG